MKRLTSNSETDPPVLTSNIASLIVVSGDENELGEQTTKNDVIEDDDWLFDVGSTGALSSDRIVSCGISVLKNKCELLKFCLGKEIDVKH